MKHSKSSIILSAPLKKVWDITFTNFGDTYKFNPLIQHSQQIAGTAGEKGCERRCEMDNGQAILERIDGFENLKWFEVEIYQNPMKIMKFSRARFEFKSISENQTRVDFTYSFETKPGIMSILMKPMMGGMFKKVLQGLKNYAENGVEVKRR